MSEKKILFKNLTKLITEPALYYDEGIAKYLIQRIGEESLREDLFSTNTLSYRSLHTNFMGLIEIVNRGRLKLENCNKENINPRFLSEIEGLQNTYERWIDLIKNTYPNLIGSEKYVLNYENDKLRKIDQSLSVGLSSILSLNDLESWINFKKLDDKFELTDSEYEQLMFDFYDRNRDSEARYKYSFLERDEYAVNLLCEKTLYTFEYMRKRYKKSEVEMINFLFSTHTFKLLLKLDKNSHLSKLFDINSLESLFKKSSLKENLIAYPNMLSTLLPMTSEDKWIEAIFGNKKVNINNLFSPILTMLGGTTIKEMEQVAQKQYMSFPYSNNNKKKYTNVNLINEVVERLKFFKDTIQEKVVSEPLSKETILFYLLIAKTGRANIFKEVINLVGLPEENEENKFLFNIFQSQEYRKENSMITFKEMQSEALKEKLTSELISKSATKKMKI